jgi:hypothetical protein
MESEAEPSEMTPAKTFHCVIPPVGPVAKLKVLVEALAEVIV